MVGLITWTDTASLAANASMSAQDTIPGHFSSTASFITSMTSKPAVKVRLGIDFFSPVLLAVESNITEASQPWNIVNC